jgi:hypothetical protein
MRCEAAAVVLRASCAVVVLPLRFSTVTCLRASCRVRRRRRDARVSPSFASGERRGAPSVICACVAVLSRASVQ